METEVIVALIAAAGGFLAGMFGGGGYATRWLEKKIAAEKATISQRDSLRKKRYKYKRQMDRSLGRLLFWIVRGIIRYEKKNGTEFWNGEVEDSFRAYEAAEQECKKIDDEWQYIDN